MNDYEDVLYEVQDRIAVVRLNRPEFLNAFTPAMGRGLQQAIAAAIADQSVRVIVLTGAGRGFCAGADMKLLQQINPEVVVGQKPEASGHYGGRFGYLLNANKPVIAALNGPAA